MAGHGDCTIDAPRLKSAWKALKPTFGHLTPEDVTRDLCRSYAQQRRNKNGDQIGNGTIRRELSALRAALRWQMPNTPAVFDLPSPPRPRDRYLTRDEYRRLLDGAVEFHTKLFIRLALATGARKAAVLDLKWGAVDFKKRLINLGVVEGGKPRAIVPITDGLMEWLQTAYRARQTDYVIEWDGQPVKAVRRSFATAAKNAGLGNVTPHVLRHTAAVWMAEGGRSMDEIAQYLGHTETQTTIRVYARYSPDYLRKAARLLDVEQCSGGTHEPPDPNAP